MVKKLLPPLLFFAIVFTACSHRSLPFNVSCKSGDKFVTANSDQGNYYNVMEMSADDYRKFIKPLTFKRMIFQFKNVSSKDGRNEFEMESYAWYKGVAITDRLRYKGFLKKVAGSLLMIDPKEPFSYANVELRRPDAKYEKFDGCSSIQLIPFFDKCRKTINIRMVGIKGSEGVAKKSASVEQNVEILAAGELYMNPCPPDIPNPRSRN